MNTFAFFLAISLIASVSYAFIEMDFCVADLSLPRGPVGYSCKNPSNLTVDDFIYTGFRVSGNNSNLATANEYPALNGLGISMAKLYFAVNGVIPLHSHRTSEVIIVNKGRIIAGFIDTNNVAYYKTLHVGDVMIFPEAMLHFQVNVGKTPALAFVSLNSANPGFQLTAPALFAGNLPAKLIEQTMLLSHEEVMRMKALFGGNLSAKPAEQTMLLSHEEVMRMKKMSGTT